MSWTGIDDILDIGGSGLQSYNRVLLEKKLFWSKGPWSTLDGHVQRVLPTSIIHGDEGLELWRKITHLPSYYQTSGEAALFVENSTELAQWIKEDSVMIDLGCGDIRKLIPLLQELDHLQKTVLYCPLDLSYPSIEEALKQIKPSLPFVGVTGLWGSFEDGVDWANRTCGDRPRMFLSLGSMFGNDHFGDAVARLKWLRKTALRHPHDTILLTMDGTQDSGKICSSYDDAEGLFTELIRKGYEHSNEVLDEEWYREEDWALSRRLTRNPTMHRFSLRAKRAVRSQTMDVTFRAGEEIDCYEGFKYGPEEMTKQFRLAGLKEYMRWQCPDDNIYQYLLRAADSYCMNNGEVKQREQ